MDRLKLLIVDDEPLARTRLRSLVADCPAPRAEVVAEAGSVAEALHQLARQPVDGVLLDIHMPGLNGLELARRLKAQEAPPAVVFVSAHAEHALDAFELNATDYLTKPVRRQRLQEALERVAQRRRLRPAGAALALGAQALAQSPTPVVQEPPLRGLDPRELPALVVSQRGRTLRIPLIDILYLKAEMKYVTLRTRQHVHVLDDALLDLEQRLGPWVVRIHRNALVARAAIRELDRRVLPGGQGEEGWAVRVEPGGEWLAVSRRQLPAVREALESPA